MTKKIIFGLALVGVLTLTACSSDSTEDADTTSSDTETETEATDTSMTNDEPPQRQLFTLEELAEFDGKNGNECYVAVDDTVYAIDSNDWVDGVHTRSNGQAKCGEDLSGVIDQSTHGRSVLDENSMTEVGDLFN